MTTTTTTTTSLAAGKCPPAITRGDATEPAPPTDENARPPDAPPAAESWKAAARVPRGDLRLALLAIDDQVNADKAAWREKHAAGGGGGGGEVDCDVGGGESSKEEFFAMCMGRTGESLRRQLESATVPVDDEEAERALDSFQSRMFSTRYPSAASDDDDEWDVESLSSVDDVDEEIDFDDNEILDRDAHDRARELRGRARELSARVISLREETAGRALEMTRRNLSELMAAHGFSEGAEKGPDETSERTAPEEDAEGNGRRDPSDPMRVALRTLETSLHDVDSNLAEKLESVKETLGTIGASVEKYQRMSQGDESVLSRTEKALFAREGQRERAAVESPEEEGESSPVNPEERLARLLAGVL